MALFTLDVKKIKAAAHKDADVDGTCKRDFESAHLILSIVITAERRQVALREDKPRVERGAVGEGGRQDDGIPRHPRAPGREAGPGRVPLRGRGPPHHVQQST